jgi:hypothetical protein
MHKKYRDMVVDASSSIDDRIRFHIEHLDEYWQRCLGFLELLEKEKKPVTSSFLRNDSFVCVRVATQHATVDIEAFCSKRQETRLRNAWEKYLKELAIIKKKTHETASAMTACAQCFGEARDLYRAVVLGESQAKKR